MLNFDGILRLFLVWRNPRETHLWPSPILVQIVDFKAHVGIDPEFAMVKSANLCELEPTPSPPQKPNHDLQNKSSQPIQNRTEDCMLGRGITVESDQCQLR